MKRLLKGMLVLATITTSINFPSTFAEPVKEATLQEPIAAYTIIVCANETSNCSGLTLSEASFELASYIHAFEGHPKISRVLWPFHIEFQQELPEETQVAALKTIEQKALDLLKVQLHNDLLIPAIRNFIAAANWEIVDKNTALQSLEADETRIANWHKDALREVAKDNWIHEWQTSTHEFRPSQSCDDLVDIDPFASFLYPPIPGINRLSPFPTLEERVTANSKGFWLVGGLGRSSPPGRGGGYPRFKEFHRGSSSGRIREYSVPPERQLHGSGGGPGEGGGSGYSSPAYVTAVCLSTSDLSSTCIQQSPSEASRQLARHILNSYVDQNKKNAFRLFFGALTSRDKQLQTLMRLERKAVELVAAKLREDLKLVVPFYYDPPEVVAEKTRLVMEDERRISNWQNTATSEADSGRNWSYNWGSQPSFSYQATLGPAYNQLVGISMGIRGW